MKTFDASRSFVRGALAAAFVIGVCAAGATPAAAGRPTIFELQEHLRQLPEKQRAREGARPMPMSVPLADNEELPHQAPGRRR